MEDNNNIHIPINHEGDIVTARQKVRELCNRLDFSSVDQTLVATAISELARNIIEYAKAGEIKMSLVEAGDRKGIAIIAKDSGPGIPNIELAMQDGYSTSKGLGLGLPGCKRIMNEFNISSRVGKGTVVTVKKWKN
jgi:serine/threonine-protein kinase RsbT